MIMGTLRLLCCALLLVTVVVAIDQCGPYCSPGQHCWPTYQQFYELGYSLDGEMLVPTSDNFSEVVVMYNRRMTRFPYLVVMVESKEDVQRCVLFAKSHKMKLTIRSSGHDYIGRSTADMSLQINFARMKKIEINLNSSQNAAGELTAEPGNAWLDVYKEVDKINRVIVGGSAHTVALGGYTLGGGHSPIGRKYGMAVDNLLEVEMVTADGNIVISNANMTKMLHGNGSVTVSSNTDLFWALRGGGGGTFGVVTKFTYKLHMPPQAFVRMTCFMPMYVGTQDVGTTYLRDLNNLVAKGLAPEWGGYQLISGSPYPNATGTSGSLTVAMNHAGAWGSSSFNEILPFSSKYPQSCIFKNLSTFMEYEIDAKDAPEANLYLFNSLIQPDGFTDAYFDFLINGTLHDEFGCTTTLIGGNMQLMPPDSTAVNPSFRTAAHSLSCGHGWIDGRTEDVNVHKGEELAKKIIQLGRGVYFNEPSSYLPNWKTEYWGGHYDRLLRIKQIWDPNNFFTCHHCVGSDIKQPSLVDTIIGK